MYIESTDPLQEDMVKTHIGSKPDPNSSQDQAISNHIINQWIVINHAMLQFKNWICFGHMHNKRQAFCISLKSVIVDCYRPIK